MSPEPLTYTVSQAAEALGVNRKSLYRLIRAGDVPHLLIGRCIRIPRAGLSAWAEDQAYKTARERKLM